MLDEIPDDMKPVFIAIGCLTVAWSSAEYMLDHMIKTVYDQYGGDKIEPSPPISFNRKPKFLRKAFASHPDLVGHLDDLNELLEEASDLADHRNWCIHGVANHTAPGIPIKKIIHGSPSKIATRNYSIDDIWLLSNRALALAANLTFFAIKNIWVEGQDEVNDVVSKFVAKHVTGLPDGDTSG